MDASRALMRGQQASAHTLPAQPHHAAPCTRLTRTRRRALARPVASVAQETAQDTAPGVAGVRRTTQALKEWNVALSSVHQGLQTILLRKGGIREPVFKPPGREFLLFPTSFHSDTDLLKPGYRDAEWCRKAMALEPKNESVLVLDTYVQVTGAWVTEDPNVLTALDDLHIWTQDFVEARLKWRGKQPLTLLELRAWQLQPPLELKVDPEFFGCFSFVDVASGLAKPVSLETAKPALTDTEFKLRQETLRSRLAGIQHTALELPL